MDFLRADGPFASTVYKICNMVLISAIWTIFCIPVFTAGASTTALYYTVQKSIKNDRGNSWQCFWESFKANFKQSTLINLIFMAITAVFVTDIQIVSILKDTGYTQGFMKNLFIVVLVIMCIYAFWVFFYIARFESTIKEALKNSAVLAVVHFPYTLGAAAIGAFSIFLIWLVRPLILIMPATSVWMMSQLTEKVFRRYMTDEAKQLEDDLNFNWRDDYAGKPNEEKKDRPWKRRR